MTATTMIGEDPSCEWHGLVEPYEANEKHPWFNLPTRVHAWAKTCHDARPCPVCGRQWQPWANSNMPCHGKCLFSREGALEVYDDTRTGTVIAKSIGVSLPIVKSGIKLGTMMALKRAEKKVKSEDRILDAAEPLGAWAAKFHEHMDQCDQCREHPFDLCRSGAKLLTSAPDMREPVSKAESGAERVRQTWPCLGCGKPVFGDRSVCEDPDCAPLARVTSKTS